MLAALDSNVFIAFLARDDVFYEDAARVLRLIDSRKIKAVYSSIVLGEVIYTSKRHEALEIVTSFFEELSGCEDIPADKAVCYKAAVLRQTHASLKLPDAIHLASAIVSGADVFVTADKRLARLAQKEIKSLFLSDFTP